LLLIRTLAISGWRGLSRTLLSIGTMTEGTRRATLDFRSSQALPMDWVLSGAGRFCQSSGELCQIQGLDGEAIGQFQPQ
jgi:hypothetical protein